MLPMLRKRDRNCLKRPPDTALGSTAGRQSGGQTHKSHNSVVEKINILMVDDQPGKLLTYEAILAELGENLIKAHSGKEALEQLLKNDIALILMDVNMPGMDGFEAAQMIHGHPRFQNTPIVFVSGIHVTDLDRLRGYQQGAVDYVSIPVVPQLLRAKVRVFAELHRKTKQLEVLNARMTTLQDEERRHLRVEETE